MDMYKYISSHIINQQHVPMPSAIINRVALQEYQEYNNKLPNFVTGTTKHLVALQIQVNDYRKSDRKKCCQLIKGKAIPLVLDRPRGIQEVEVPRFQDNRPMKVVRL